MTQWAIQPRNNVVVQPVTSNEFLTCAHDFVLSNIYPHDFEVYSKPHEFLAESTPHKFEVKVC